MCMATCYIQSSLLTLVCHAVQLRPPGASPRGCSRGHCHGHCVAPGSRCTLRRAKVESRRKPPSTFPSCVRICILRRPRKCHMRPHACVYAFCAAHPRATCEAQAGWEARVRAARWSSTHQLVLRIAIGLHAISVAHARVYAWGLSVLEACHHAACHHAPAGSSSSTGMPGIMPETEPARA